MLCGVWTVSPNASEWYVDGSQSLQCSRTSFPKVCLNSSHLYSPTLLISTPQSDAGLRSKRSGASGLRAAAALAAISAGRGCVADAADAAPRARAFFWVAGDFAFLHVLPLFFYLVRV